MAIGMSYEEFWYGDPETIFFTIEAYRIKRKQDAIDADTLAWTIGRYTMLGTNVILSAAFDKNSTAKYPSEPTLAIALDEELARKKREQQILKQHADFRALISAMKAQKSNNGESTHA